MNKINAFLTNWKTSLGGVSAILAAVSAIASILADGYQPGDFDQIAISIGAIGAGFSMLFARDSDKSSEDQPKG